MNFVMMAVMSSRRTAPGPRATAGTGRASEPAGQQSCSGRRPLAERGLARATIEGIAARAGVAKQTIDRSGGAPDDILFNALVADADQHLHHPGHGDLGRDLTTSANSPYS